jgi:hypothetical protein
VSDAVTYSYPHGIADSDNYSGAFAYRERHARRYPIG